MNYAEDAFEIVSIGVGFIPDAKKTEIKRWLCSALDCVDVATDTVEFITAVVPYLNNIITMYRRVRQVYGDDGRARILLKTLEIFNPEGGAQTFLSQLAEKMEHTGTHGRTYKQCLSRMNDAICRLEKHIIKDFRSRKFCFHFVFATSMASKLNTLTEDIVQILVDLFKCAGLAVLKPVVIYKEIIVKNISPARQVEYETRRTEEIERIERIENCTHRHLDYKGIPGELVCNRCDQLFECDHLMNEHLDVSFGGTRGSVKCNTCEQIFHCDHNTSIMPSFGGLGYARCRLCSEKYACPHSWHRRRWGNRHGRGAKCGVCNDELEYF